ncbi:hemicentin-1-like isoform X4 [Haliotis rubra]|uniref:hemicentin-1-like isoform X4 n=1 Tax=Haliotis rubra TaxID=36100 RepID=UPI001EE5D06E|nr:hemicentin-1-like isoform X4 [Haliotis rubra]
MGVDNARIPSQRMRLKLDFTSWLVGLPSIQRCTYHTQCQTLSLQGSSSSVLLGDSFQFTCTVTGGGPLQGTLSFQRGAGATPYRPCIVNSRTCAQFTGDPGYSCGCVTGQTKIFYTNITAVSRNDSNNWTCQDSNSISNTISVDVQYAPVITSVPSNKDVTENTSPNIDCSSNITPGNPSTTSYRWTGPGGYSKDGAVLDRPITRTQGGEYICTASNTAGLSDTAQVNINVQYAPVITSVPSNKDVTEKTSPNIDCSSNITPGNPSTTSYRWTGPGGYSKDGAVLDRPVTRTQGGVYICTASNTAGLSDTAQVNINVPYAPVITSVPSNKDVTENTSPNINCSSNITPGNPSTTSYRWTGPGGYSKDGAVLDRPVTRTQGGVYSCTASNAAGLSDTAQVNVNVQYADTPRLTVSMPQVQENGTVYLACSVTSSPTAQMTIRHMDNDSFLLTEETNSAKFVIHRVQCLQNGTYQCSADNSQIPGAKTTSASLDVLCYPRRDFRKKFRSNSNM